MSQSPKEFLAQLEQRHRAADRFRQPNTQARDNFFGLSATGGMTGFAGAQRDRLTEDWNPQTASWTSIHRRDSTLLRARARDLVLNNPFAASAVNVYIANVIECGLLPKPKVSDSNIRLAQVNGWNRWSGENGDNEADITGHQNIYEMMALWLEEVLVGGGCLTRYVVMDRRTQRDRLLPLSMELIPEERFADDSDDYVQFHNRRKSKNRIIRGVEIESNGKPVRYWIRPQHPNDVTLDIEPIAYSAEDCHYAFRRRGIGQYRGFTFLHVAIMWLWKLGYYTDNELMASALRSCFAAVIQHSHEDWDKMGEGLMDGTPSVVDSHGNSIERLQPGIIARMTAPGEITSMGPNIQPADGMAWLMFIQRAIGIATDLSYEELIRDYSQGSFSSTRQSANSDRKRFRRWQNFTRNNFCRPTWRRFSQWASWRGLDGFPSLAEYVSRVHEVNDVMWRAPGWQSVNPWDDARAAVLEVENGMGTRDNYVSGRGNDWEDTFDQLEREHEGAVRRGLTFTTTVDPAEASSEQDNAPKKQQGSRQR